MQMKLPKVSIILPTYNGARHIRRSIGSCLNQTYKNLELVIINDGSCDDTLDIIKSFKDSRVKCVNHEINLGLPYALNTGFNTAAGEYLTWTSDDNFYNDNAIERMYSFLEGNKCYFVYSDYFEFKNDIELKPNLIKLPEIPDLGKGNQIGACFLYSRKIKDVIGDYDPETIMAEDWDYWIRVSKKFSMHHLSEPLYFYRVHPESLYVSRFYEAKVAGILVRVKHRLLSTETAVDVFTSLIANKYPGPHIIGRIIAKLIFARKIASVLNDFQYGGASFKDTKLTLNDILSSDD